MGFRIGPPRRDRRARPTLRFPVFASAVLLSTLAACPTLSEIRSPTPEPPQRDYRRQIGPDGRLLRDPAGLLEDTLPAARLGIASILAQGYADQVSRSDFYHLHIVYPNRLVAPYPAPAMLLSNLGFLFHTKERPHKIRAEWLADLAVVRDPFVEEWLAVVGETDFDYRDFFYGSGRIRSRPPLPDHHIDRIAVAWKNQRPISASVRTLGNRIIYIHGSRQPGYDEAAVALFWPRSFLARVSDPEPVPAEVRPKEWFSIATVYFSPSAEGGSTVAGEWTPDGESAPGRVPTPVSDRPGRVMARYWGYDFVLVPTSAN